MNRGYLVHIVPALHLVRIARSGAMPMLEVLLVNDAVHCVDALDGSPPPEGIQMLLPTFEELSLGASRRKGLGPADRVMLAVGATRRLVCVSDEPALARAACAFGVELVGVSGFLGEFMAAECITEFNRVSLLPVARFAPCVAVDAPTSNAPTDPQPATSNPSPVPAARARHSSVRKRGRHGAAHEEDQQLALALDAPPMRR